MANDLLIFCAMLCFDMFSSLTILSEVLYLLLIYFLNRDMQMFSSPLD